MTSRRFTVGVTRLLDSHNPRKAGFNVLIRSRSMAVSYLVIAFSMAIFIISHQGAAFGGMIHIGTGFSGVQGDPDSNVLLTSAPLATLPTNPFIVNRVVVSSFNSWAVPLPGTQWISPVLGNFVQFGSLAGSAPVGDYTFRFSFELPTSFTNPELDLIYFSDNSMQSILLNGNAINFTGSTGFATGTSSTSNDSFFTIGTNTIDVTLRNLQGTGYNPAGLDLSGTVQFQETNLVPEPSSIALFALGIICLVFMQRPAISKITRRTYQRS